MSQVGTSPVSQCAQGARSRPPPALAPVERVERLAALLVVVATLASLLARDWRVALGVGLGGALAVLNFAALRRIMQGIFTSDSRRRQTVMAVLLMTKFALLAVAIYVIVRFVPVQAIALIGGISVVVLSIFIEVFRSVLCRAPASSE